MSFPMNHKLDHLKYESDEDDSPILRNVPVPTTEKPNVILSFLEQLKNESDPVVWEQYSAKVLPILDDLDPLCKNIATCPKLPQEVKYAASNWVQHIGDTREHANRPDKTVIGVFGNTGDGKSSTINALLGEGSILPTNCMRACTACAIELSYNHETDEESPYRAEVEFISRQTWLGEVKLALDHLTAEDDRDHSDTTLSPNDVAKFLAKGVIGRGLSGHSNNKADEDQMAYWPLVKTVRIYTKAEVLSNGLTVVDLPGHQDWDAGRAAVATDRMKSCSGLWIMAPINRAADNKTAKDLLSGHFKRQLQLDGSFSAVTFICSNTDDLTLEPAVRNLKTKLDPKTKEAWVEAKALGQQIIAIEKEIRASRAKRSGTQEAGQMSGAGRPFKRARSMPASDIGFINVPHGGPRLEATAVQSNVQIAKEKQLEDLKKEKDSLLDGVRSACIRHRNDISRDAIRQYFATILRETDQQRMAGLSAVVGQVNGPVPDFDALSRHLPIFCTSSHVFQGLKGLFEADSASLSGFNTVQDTEIPQLREHAQELTEVLRVAKHKEVLRGICRLLNSLSIWTENESSQYMALDGVTLGMMLMKLEEMDRLRGVALSHAVTTARTWAAPALAGGLPYGTLRGTFRRDGVWGKRDFNEEISDAFKMGISGPWESFFRDQVPEIVDKFGLKTADKLTLFHDNIVCKLGLVGLEEIPAFKKLKDQLDLYRDELVRLAVASRGEIDTAKKNANRPFTPVVAEHMAGVYAACLQIKGPGAVGRMQLALENHVRGKKQVMFPQVIVDIDTFLDNAVGRVHLMQVDKIKKISASMKSDYTLALAAREESARRAEAGFKEVVKMILQEVEELLE
ncbi:hypothetical protein CMUS01_11952 [Colletotrichum musicola]|uniref:Dynamin N-terminal domain-containing protein n=1 Tax=Colletotrichum musicola TaxID=2175873 RepID=A0A8H6JT78_9PEZI|nr:hypothetical protein CMUS01_11952 [Colletotrichum musicola]